MYALMALIFVLGYLCIALEHPLKIDKAASAILTAVICWTLLVLGADSILPLIGAATPGASGNDHHVTEELRQQVANGDTHRLWQAGECHHQSYQLFITYHPANLSLQNRAIDAVEEFSQI